MRVPQSEVSIELRRLAAEHLESIRGIEMGEGADLAQIVGEVCPLFRPDLEEVAYWEFEVDLDPSDGKSVITSSALSAQTFSEQSESMFPAVGERPKNGLEGTGFIIVATGEHDVPVPHWSLQKAPPSRELEAKGRETGKRIARIYRLDALAYLAEDESGQEVARSGQIPVPVEGLGHDLGRRAGEISSMTAKPQREVDDKEVDKVKHTVERSGPKSPDVRLMDPGEWPELKRGYADSFGPFLDVVRKRAQEPWRIQKLIRKFGEGVLEDEPLTVALLDPHAAVSVSGEGASMIDIAEAPSRRAVRLRARKGRRKKEADFNVHIRYGTGEEETLSFFVVSKDTPSNRRGEGALGGEEL